MAVFDLYSKRRKRELGQTKDVFTYDKIPRELRIQIIHIWNDAIGEPGLSEWLAEEIHESYHEIAKVLRREYSTFQLVQRYVDPNDSTHTKVELIEWFLAEQDAGRVL